MGTNYYARIIPTKERKQKLHDAIESDSFELIEKLAADMYGSIRKDWDNNEIKGGVVHLGKIASGWKFLWNPNIYIFRYGHIKATPHGREWVEDPSEGKYVYPLTKKGLHDFIFREDVLIYDEYDELQDKEEFWKMTLEWGQGEEGGGWDAAAYERYELGQGKDYQMYPVTGELTDFLRQEGYEFTSASNSDFYSDGLRFAGFTEFS